MSGKAAHKLVCCIQNCNNACYFLKIPFRELADFDQAKCRDFVQAIVLPKLGRSQLR
jgi:hypothetical protein